jgi:hypothetical protein
MRLATSIICLADDTSGYPALHSQGWGHRAVIFLHMCPRYPFIPSLVIYLFTRQTALGLGGNDRPARTYFSGYRQYDDTVTEVNLQATGSQISLRGYVQGSSASLAYNCLGREKGGKDGRNANGRRHDSSQYCLVTFHRARSARLILLCW